MSEYLQGYVTIYSALFGICGSGCFLLSLVNGNKEYTCINVIFIYHSASYCLCFCICHTSNSRHGIQTLICAPKKYLFVDSAGTRTTNSRVRKFRWRASLPNELSEQYFRALTSTQEQNSIERLMSIQETGHYCVIKFQSVGAPSVGSI